MTDTLRPAVPSATRKGTVVTSVVALVLAVLETGFGAYCWYITVTDPSDDPLVALGFLVAIVVGVPGLVAAVLAGLGWLLADRVAGLVLAVLAAVSAALPVLPFLFFASPTF